MKPDAMKAEKVEILDEGRALRVHWSDGESQRFHALWLRDNALDPLTRSNANGQRLITVLDIPAGTRLASAELTAWGDVGLIFEPGRHQAVYPAGWLRRHGYDRPAPAAPGWLRPEIETWDRGLQDGITSARHDRLRHNRAALGEWLAGVERHGFAVITHMPTHSGGLCEVAELFGYVRETNYGRWFEVRAEVNPTNLAYTNLGLQAHTDNPYRDPVPTLQLLACLENTVEGGESIVVDGFAVARRLQAEDAGAFDLLARHAVRFEYAGSPGVCLRSKRPIIELGPDGEMLAIRFNNRSAAAFTDVPYDEMEAFYAAYRRFAEILEDPAMEVSFKLRPGEFFIVDNTRVLHARKAFSGSGSRWLQGCYADKDGLLSTLAAIRTESAKEAAE